MGQAKLFKKQRKYARQEAMKIYEKFSSDFKTDDILKPCPRFIPEMAWNFLIWLVIKK